MLKPEEKEKIVKKYLSGESTTKLSKFCQKTNISLGRKI